ncbi:hypothetical protein CC86DRAFT_388059 [Ophiobolus disseminans]|uniref:Transcription factor domain-containing protein n=1 Tax=Ophiobolus disseminans TaxID=1469910 RepID=A0A6A6ZF59_9PLEO|nr:hypothetical protein CC86DRAFT_388059 [Ophiobolus disseminans]
MDRNPHRDQQALRPLLPAPAGAHKEPGHPRKGLRTNACENCRTPCVARDTECKYGETEARQIRRRYQQLKEKRTAHEDLYEMLQVMSERDAADVFRRIRGGAKAEAIVRHVQEGSLLLELSLSPETRTRYEFPYVPTIPPALMESVYFRSHIFDAIRKIGSPPDSPTNIVARQSNYAMPLYAADMVDTALAEAKPSKWTRVSSNDLLLRKLLEGYFTYEYPWQFLFHKDYFIEDMLSGDDRFCSPLLVNALLAKACTCSRIVPDSTKFWDPDTLTYRFLAEAKRLWELEDGEPKLTTVHAGCLINAAMDVIGHDKLGIAYATKALSIAHDLGVFRAPLTDDQKMNEAKAFTSWGIASWLTVQSYYFFKPPYLSRPPPHPLPNVEIDSKWYSEVWLHYPNDELLYPMGFGFNMKALCELRMIMRDICAVSFIGDEAPQKMPWSQVLGFQARLQAWCEELPAVLSPKSLLYPSHIKLHVIIMLFDAQLSPVENDGSPLSEHQRAAARDITAQAIAQLEALLRIYYLRHGFESYDSMLLVHLVHLGNVALTRLARLERNQEYEGHKHDTVESLRSTLILCLKGLYDQSKNFYLSGVVLGVMKNRLSAENQSLVGQYITLKDPDADSEPTDRSQTIISDYVIPVVNLNEDPQAGRLANMVHEFGRLSHND